MESSYIFHSTLPFTCTPHWILPFCTSCQFFWCPSRSGYNSPNQHFQFSSCLPDVESQRTESRLPRSLLGPSKGALKRKLEASCHDFDTGGCAITRDIQSVAGCSQGGAQIGICNGVHKSLEIIGFTPQGHTCQECWQLWPIVGGAGNGAAGEDWC